MSHHTVPLGPSRSGRFPRVPVLPPADLTAGLRTGAGFAAVFGTLWFVQGLFAAAGPLAGAAGLLPGLVIGAYLYRTRGANPQPPTAPGLPARRYLTRATVIQLAVSVPGAVLVQLVAGPAAVLPFVIVTVGLYLAAIAPALRRWHTATAGLLLTALPFGIVAAFDGTARTAVIGGVCGGLFLAKGFADLAASRHVRTSSELTLS